MIMPHSIVHGLMIVSILSTGCLFVTAHHAEHCGKQGHEVTVRQVFVVIPQDVPCHLLVERNSLKSVAQPF